MTTQTRRRPPVNEAGPDPLDVHVGARLRLRRTLLGMSQDQLAKATGVTFQQVQKYERGANRLSASRLYDVARSLGVSVGYFFEDAEDVARGLPYEAATAALTKAANSDRDPSSKTESVELVRDYWRSPAAVRSAVRDLLTATAVQRRPEEAQP